MVGFQIVWFRPLLDQLFYDALRFFSHHVAIGLSLVLHFTEPGNTCYKTVLVSVRYPVMNNKKGKL